MGNIIWNIEKACVGGEGRSNVYTHFTFFFNPHNTLCIIIFIGAEIKFIGYNISLRVKVYMFLYTLK